MLAHSSPARIVAVDNLQPFIDVQNREARRLGITNRLEARVADMRRLDFADGSLDLIWCEGAIYNMRVEAGLRDWLRLLPRNGHVALTEVCWRKPEQPATCVAFWNQEYPAIRDTPPRSRKSLKRAAMRRWGTSRSPGRRGGATTIGHCRTT